jgi:F-type H+-transporting ATPase subunit b
MINLLAQVAYWAAEEGEAPPEGIDLVIPAIEELIAGIIAFAVVFILVWWKVRPAIAETLAARQEAITGQLTEAEKAKQEAESLLQDYQQQLAKAKEEANKIVEDAKGAAESVKADIVAKAEAEAAEKVAKARDEAAAEKERVSGQLRDEVMSLSMALTEKVVGDGIDESTQKRLVEQFIDDVGELEA